MPLVTLSRLPQPEAASQMAGITSASPLLIKPQICVLRERLGVSQGQD